MHIHLYLSIHLYLPIYFVDLSQSRAFFFLSKTSRSYDNNNNNNNAQYSVKYACDLKLKDAIIPQASKTGYTVHPRHVVVHCQKKYEGRWGSLLEDKKKMKPFIKADFDLWCDSDEEEEKGGFDMSQFGKMMGGMGGMPGMGNGKGGMPDMATLQNMIAQEKAKQGHGHSHGGHGHSHSHGDGCCSSKEVDSDDDDMPELE